MANLRTIELLPIYNHPVVPEEGEHYRRCKTRPMTRAEMKGDFPQRDLHEAPGLPGLPPGAVGIELASTIQIYTRYFMKTDDGREHPGWRENLKKLADAGIFLCYVGLGGTDEEAAAWQEFLLETFGAQYIGAKGDSELDGGYTGGWCWGDKPYARRGGLPVEPSPSRSRAQARAEYDRVLEAFYARTRHHGMSISSLGYGCHYAAEHEARMLGIEAEESLPSDTLLWSFCRGAAKQYDLLMAVSISPSSRWGQKWYSRDGQNMAEVEGITGPDYGPSEGLSKREWYLAYMYGASISFFSGGIFYQAKYQGRLSGDYEPFIMAGGLNKPGWGLLEANLTPLGRIQVEGQEFAADHPVRGVPYMPVALMLDEDHGWNPPRHLYRKDEDHVWGNIPYSRLDYQIDNFFRWVYPDYELASYYRDERGYITNTPFGDLFEVILSNAPARCLAKYRALVLLGDLGVENREGLSDRLAHFLEEGGIVVAGADQWAGISASLAGIEVGDSWQTDAGVVLTDGGKRFEEAAFECQSVRAGTGELLLQTADGAPLIVRQPVGRGSLYLVAARGWGQVDRRHAFLKSVKYVLGSLFRDLNLVEIEGRPIFYLVNVTDREDELILTLCNNSPDLAWEGKVRIKGEAIESVEAWRSHSEVGLEDGALRCGVPANDVRIFKLKAERGFLPLMFHEIDWKRLGVGIPDTDFQNSPGRRPGHL